MKRIEDLQINGYKIVQDDKLYCFTSDSVLLSKFVKAKKGEVVADFCSGSGIIGIHFLALNPSTSSVTLFEMQKELCELSKESVELNNMQEKVFPVNIKLQDIGKEYDEKFSLILVNPPFVKVKDNYSVPLLSDKIALAKYELTITLDEIVFIASKKLKNGGRLGMVHRADRLADIIEAMRKYKIEPKKIEFVSGSFKKAPYLVLIEGVKGGKPGLKILPLLINGER